MTRGAFITLEGAEGVGKSTCLETIENTLLGIPHPVVVTREPGGTALGEQIRAWILDGDHGALTAEVEALLMFAARADHLQRLVIPSLDAGKWVVCDRFTDATYAYQGGGRGADEGFLDNLVEAVQGRLRPDLTLLLDAPVEVGLERIRARRHDHFERENSAFFERVRQAYLDRAARDPRRIRIVDASQPLAEVQARILAELDRFCSAFAPAEVRA